MKSFLAIILLMTISCSMIHAQSVLWEPGGVCLAKNNLIFWDKQAGDYADGSVVVAWTDDIAGLRQIWGMRYSADGTPLWEAPVVLSDPGLNVYGFSIVAHPDGGFYIGYSATITFAGQSVYLQRFSVSHQPLWGEGSSLVIAQDIQTIEAPQCVSDGQGGVYILYAHNPPYGEVLRRYNQEGISVPGFDSIAFPVYIEQQCPVVSADGQGGVVVCFLWGGELRIQRINPNGVAVWGTDGIVLQSAFSNRVFSISPLSESGIAIVWAVGDDLFGQKVSLDGQVVCETPLTLLSQGWDDLWNIEIVTDQEANTFVACQYYGICTIQKWAVDNSLPWGEDGLVFDPEEDRHISSIAILGDNSGGCQVCYGETDLSNLAKTHFARVNTSGEIVGQCELDSQRASSYTLMLAQEDCTKMIFFDRIRLMHQIVDQANNLLIESDETIIARGISPYGREITVIPVGDRFYHFWNSGNGKIKLQIQDGNGQPVCDEAGIDLLDEVLSYNLTDQSITYLPEEHRFIFVFRRLFEGYDCLYCQYIDENGLPLWDEALPLSEELGVGCYTISLVDGQIIVWWEAYYHDETQPVGYYKIQVQKILDGIPQLGNSGSTIIQVDNSDCQIVRADEGYLLWKKNYSELRLSWFDLSGADLYRWPPDGVVIHPNASKSFLCRSDNVQYVVYNNREDDFCRVQAVGNDGTPLWEGYGRSVGENMDIITALSSDDGIMILARHWNGTLNELRLLKVDANGDVLWNIEMEPGMAATYADMIVTPYGTGVAYVKYISGMGFACFQFIRPDGTPTSAQPVTIAEDPASVVNIAIYKTSDTTALVTWDLSRLDYDDYVYTWHKSQLIDLSTVAVPDTETPGLAMTLDQARPNPFNPETTIGFSLPVAAKVRLEVFNIRGQRVDTPVADTLPAGKHEVLWKGCDENGHPVASGVYFYRLESVQETITRKMLLLK